jgi:hypothetical protein
VHIDRAVVQVLQHVRVLETHKNSSLSVEKQEQKKLRRQCLTKK